MNKSGLPLDLLAWSYDRHFATPRSARQEVIERVEDYVVTRHLERHTFFERTRREPAALLTWLSQELVITNAFSQLVLYAASHIENVHIRAALAAVAYGEHGRLTGGQAPGAHPVLLDKLRSSVNLLPSEVTPLGPTIEFIHHLSTRVDDPLAALAAIGVGNERLIFPEYEAVWESFETHFPRSNFRPFLQANLGEDEEHSKLCYLAALELIESDEDERRYEECAIASVEARWSYFDGLEELFDQGSTPRFSALLP